MEDRTSYEDQGARISLRPGLCPLEQAGYIYAGCSPSPKFCLRDGGGPYIGCKVSVATPVTSPKGAGSSSTLRHCTETPYDGHTLGAVIADLEELTGVETRRIHVDKGYRGHNHPHRFRVWISGQVRRVTASIRREMSAALPWSRSSAISRPSTAWAATISRDPRATASTPSLPLPATTCMGLMVSSGDVRSVYLLLCGCPGPSGLRAVADRSQRIRR